MPTDDDSQSVKQNVSAMVAGLQMAASKDLAEADRLLAEARDARQQAMDKLELAVELARVYAERVDGTYIAAEDYPW